MEKIKNMTILIMAVTFIVMGFNKFILNSPKKITERGHIMLDEAVIEDMSTDKPKTQCSTIFRSLKSTYELKNFSKKMNSRHADWIQRIENYDCSEFKFGSGKLAPSEYLQSLDIEISANIISDLKEKEIKYAITSNQKEADKFAWPFTDCYIYIGSDFVENTYLPKSLGGPSDSEFKRIISEKPVGEIMYANGESGERSWQCKNKVGQTIKLLEHSIDFSDKHMKHLRCVATAECTLNERSIFSSCSLTKGSKTEKRLDDIYSCRNEFNTKFNLSIFPDKQ